MRGEKLKIGILLDSLDVCAWEFAMLERIMKSDYATLELLVVNTHMPKSLSTYQVLKKNRQQLLYLIYTKIDTILGHTTPDAFARKNLRTLVPNVPVISVVPIRKNFSDYFEPAAIDAIRAYRLDVLIRLGFRILKGDILTIPRYGVWSYHHGDNTINRGGPAGFWEVMEGWPETGSVLQILTEDLDNGQILYRSWTRTHPLSPAKNKQGLYWKTAAFLPRKLEELYRTGAEQFFAKLTALNAGLQFYCAPLYTPPSNRDMLRFLWKQFWKICGSTFRKRFGVEQWFLLFAFGPDISTTLRKFTPIMPPSDRYWADPHVMFREDTFFIFIEEFMHTAMKGHIAVIEMDRQGHFSQPRKIVERAEHLSYPCVLEWEQRVYMVLAVDACKTIELYECLDFPYAWSHKMTLMTGIDAVDATLLRYNETWWLFAAVKECAGAPYDDELCIFYADNLLTSQWQAHPLNPVISDVKRARPAGKIFTHQGKVCRPSQNCSHVYGYGFNIHEILTLTKTDYLENIVSEVKPNWDNTIAATHTFAYDNGLTVIDAMTRKYRCYGR